MLLMAVFAPWAVGQTRSTVYQKVTEAPQDWTAGSYLLVYNDSKAATKSTTTSGYTWYLNTTSVAVVSNTIENPNGAEVITFELFSGNVYYLKNSESNYLKATRYKSGSTYYPRFEWVSTADSYNCGWQMTYNDGILTLKWNNNNDYKMAVSGDYITLSSTASSFSLYAKAEIQLDYPKPTGLEITSLGSTTATLSWSAPSAEPKEGYSLTGYKYKEADAASWTSVNATTCNLTGLTAATQYTYQVVAVYTNNNDATDIQDSDPAEITFTTDCAEISIPTQIWNFDANTNMPDCWTIVESSVVPVYGNPTFPQIYNSSSYAHSGNNTLCFRGSGAQVVLMPAINESLNGKTLSFFVRAYSTSYTNTLKIGYYNSSNEFVTYETDLNISYTSYSVDPIEIDFIGLPDYVDKVAIKGLSNSNYGYIYIDDVQIKATANCKPVKNLQVGTITANSAKLKWTAGTTETNWKLQYKTNASADFSTINVTSNELDAEGYYTLGGLTENTTYNWQVAAWCDPEDETAITDYVAGTNFTTIQIPVSVDAENPFSDGFEGSINWVFVNGTQKNQWVIGTAAHNGESSTKALYISNDDGTTHSYTTSNASTTYATKTFTFEAGTYNFQYDWICNGEKGSYGNICYDYLRVALAPAGTTLNAGTSTITYNTVPAGWIALDDGVLVQQNSWSTKTVNDIEIEAGTYILVFMWTNDNGSGSQFPAGIDNFSITAQTCIAPSSLVVTDGSVTSTEASLTWTPGANSQTQWEVAYKIGNFNPESDEHLTATATTNASITLENLTPNSTYYAYVRAICNETNEVYSSWSEICSFTTDCDAYAIPYNYDFESNYDLKCWTEIKTGSTGITSTGGYPNSGAAYLFEYNKNTDQFLISPELSGVTSLGVKVTFYYKKRGSFDETFQVGYSTTTYEVASFEGNWDDEITTENSSWNTYSHIFPAGTKYIAISYPKNDNYGLYIDNISFKTPENTFTTEGIWNVSTNWLYGTLPTATDDVAINAACTIPANCTATANTITVASTGSLTIEDGGQLITNTAVEATVQKVINAHGETTADGGWYFIASPISTAVNPSDAGLITDNLGSTATPETATYDLYYFYENPGNELEWKNYRNTTFNLYNKDGYLYANEADVTLNFTGSINPATQPMSKDLDYTEGAELAGWNLVGNPFTFNTYVNMSYYKMNDDGSAIEPEAVSQTTTIAPCTGIMVQATATGQSITFSKDAPSSQNGNQGNLNIALVQANVRNNAVMDKAVLSFNEGSQLGKFYFGENAANIYFPQDNKEFAIVSSEGQGEMPLSFRANENGTYTLSFNAEEVTFNYLHLIDNMTGADVDLLAATSTGSVATYTFNARTTDYSSRFKLVFATGSNNDSDNFAFYSNGTWVIGNDGEATLQVIDVTGRVLSSETVNGSVSKAINASAGVYMLRLINGNDVKTQKIVVR